MSLSTQTATRASTVPARILGVDPAVGVTGYAVLERRPRSGGFAPHVCEGGIIRTNDSKDEADLSIRVRILYDGLVEVIEQYQPEVLALEQLFVHPEHPRTAITLAHARGVVLLAAAQRGIPVVNYPAVSIKKTITGHGRATKEQMQHAMLRELNLKRLPEPHDVADALAIALCQYYTDVYPTRAAGS